MSAIVYFAGGYLPDHPNGNVHQHWDDTTATYTEYDTTGTVVVTRPYNADETAQMQANQAAQAAQQAKEAATAQLQALAAQHATFQGDITTDATTVATHTAALTSAQWSTLSADQQHQVVIDLLAIVSRLLNPGLASAMAAHVDHLVVNGIIEPS